MSDVMTRAESDVLDQPPPEDFATNLFESPELGTSGFLPHVDPEESDT